MQVGITCRHGTVEPDVNDYIAQKAEKLLTYFERVTAIDVTVAFEKDRVGVEILVDAEHKHNFVASDNGETVPATFDSVMHKMEQQIRRYKEKLQDHRRDRPLNEVAEGDVAETDQE